MAVAGDGNKLLVCIDPVEIMAAVERDGAARSLAYAVVLNVSTLWSVLDSSASEPQPISSFKPVPGDASAVGEADADASAVGEAGADAGIGEVGDGGFGGLRWVARFVNLDTRPGLRCSGSSGGIGGNCGITTSVSAGTRDPGSDRRSFEYAGSTVASALRATNPEIRPGEESDGSRLVRTWAGLHNDWQPWAADPGADLEQIVAVLALAPQTSE